MYYKTAQLVHLAFCIGLLLFTGVVILTTIEELTFFIPYKNITATEILAPIMAIASIFLSQFMFNKLMNNIDDMRSYEKLARYKTALIVKSAILESMALFNLVACLVTHNFLFIIFAIPVLLTLWSSRPTREKLCNMLDIEDSDLD